MTWKKTKKKLKDQAIKIEDLTKIDYNRTQENDTIRKERDKLLKENAKLKEVLDLISMNANYAALGLLHLSKEVDEDTGKVTINTWYGTS